MSAPRFRCTADEPPEKPGGMYRAEHRFDSFAGLILDEFVLDGAIHLEHRHERPDVYSLHVGYGTGEGYRFTLTRRRGKWNVMRADDGA